MPGTCVSAYFELCCYHLVTLKIGLSNLPGFEPGIFWSVVRRVIHCATSPRTLNPLVHMRGHPARAHDIDVSFAHLSTFESCKNSIFANAEDFFWRQQIQRAQNGYCISFLREWDLRPFSVIYDKQSGAVEACWAHNPEVRGSKPRSAKRVFYPLLLKLHKDSEMGWGWQRQMQPMLKRGPSN